MTTDVIWIDEWIYWQLTHHSELQVITALSLISKIHNSPAVSLQRLLTVEVLQLLALWSYLHGLPCRTQLSTELQTLNKPRVRVRVRVTLRLAPSPMRLTTRDFFFQLKPYGHSPYVTPSLTRGWVCRLQLLLALTSAVILMSHSRGTHDQILLCQMSDSRNLEGKVPRIYVPPVTGWRSYTPRHWLPFPSPPTTRMNWWLSR
jgi:hypothetical protein